MLHDADFGSGIFANTFAQDPQFRLVGFIDSGHVFGNHLLHFRFQFAVGASVFVVGLPAIVAAESAGVRS